ncbi:MAG: hemerythrin domain-containing protein, partial [Thermoanaerobaculales bacterium]
MMSLKLIEELLEEHRLVDQVAGALFRYAEVAKGGETEPADVADFVRFLRVFVGGYHHEREEETLFRALADRAETPTDRGPLPVIVAEHRQASAMVDEFETLGGDLEKAAEMARSLARHLWEHVDKEDSVLLPESENRLVRNGVTRLEGRQPTADETAARDLGESLIERFLPLEDVEMVRGDGCVACGAYADTCHGIEREWWNRWDHEFQRSLDEG